MYNKFKVKKKVISIALALALAAQPLCSFSMNAFAGTGKTGVMKAPELVKSVQIKNKPTMDVLILTPGAIATGAGVGDDEDEDEDEEEEKKEPKEDVKEEEKRTIEEIMEELKRIREEEKSPTEPLEEVPPAESKPKEEPPARLYDDDDEDEDEEEKKPLAEPTPVIVDAPELIVDASKGSKYSIKWEIVSGNEDGIATINQETGQVKIDPSKYIASGPYTLKIKVTVANKSDSYDLKIVKQSSSEIINSSSTFLQSLYDSLDKNSVIAKDCRGNVPKYDKAAAYYVAWQAIFAINSNPIDSKAYIGATAAEAIISAKIVGMQASDFESSTSPAFNYVYPTGKKSYTNDFFHDNLATNYSSAESALKAAEFAENLAKKNPNNPDIVKAAKIARAAADVCNKFVKFRNTNLYALGDEFKIYFMYMTAAYTLTLLDDHAGANIAKAIAAQFPFERPQDTQGKKR